MKKIDYNTIETPTNPFEFQDALRRHVANYYYEKDPDIIEVSYNSFSSPNVVRSVDIRIDEVFCLKDIQEEVWRHYRKDRRRKPPHDILVPLLVSFDWEDLEDKWSVYGSATQLEKELADESIAEWFDFQTIIDGELCEAMQKKEYLPIMTWRGQSGRFQNVIEKLFGVFEPQYMHDWVYPMREEMKEEKQMEEWDKELNANNSKAARKMAEYRSRMR